MCPPSQIARMLSFPFACVVSLPYLRGHSTLRKEIGMVSNLLLVGIAGHREFSGSYLGSEYIVQYMVLGSWYCPIGTWCFCLPCCLACNYASTSLTPPPLYLLQKMSCFSFSSGMLVTPSSSLRHSPAPQLEGNTRRPFLPTLCRVDCLTLLTFSPYNVSLPAPPPSIYMATNTTERPNQTDADTFHAIILRRRWQVNMTYSLSIVCINPLTPPPKAAKPHTGQLLFLTTNRSFLKLHFFPSQKYELRVGIISVSSNFRVCLSGLQNADDISWVALSLCSTEYGVGVGSHPTLSSGMQL